MAYRISGDSLLRRAFGDDTVSIGAGDLVVIPAGSPHKFINTGQDVLRQTGVHGSKVIAIEWLP